jgi:putative two-component system response regulator
MQKREFLEAKILIVDDEPAKTRLVTELLNLAGFLRTRGETDSSRALAAFSAFEPDLVILDFNMQPLNGLEVLGLIEPLIESDGFLPILMLTGDISREVKEQALAAGAMDFLAKPFNATEIVLRVKNLLHTRRLHLELHEERNLLDQRVRDRTAELARAHDEMLTRLALIAEYRDDATGAHTERVANYVRMIASELKLSGDQIDLFAKASLLHDLGKVAISDAVLLKPGRFTEEEMTDMRRHSRIGGDILKGSEALLLQTAEGIARYHHERWNGTGYEGLAGEDIPLEARIAAVADVYDALTSARPYKEPWKEEAAVAEIERLSGTHFDPDVVAAFLTALGLAPAAGSGMAEAA